MHPFQHQVDKMWDLCTKETAAERQGFWLEAISLSYVLIEINLRLLLTSKVGNKKISPSKIERQRYLMELVNMAKDNGFINADLWLEIKDFNETRAQAIHALAQGTIDYSELEKTAKCGSLLIYKIQQNWIPIRIEDITIEDLK